MGNHLSDLYVVPPQFEKSAGTRMPPDIELWAESIFSVFSEQFPDLAELSGGDVEWDKNRLDSETGFGAGTIIINSNGSIVKIPIIVKNFHLQPIDIFEADGKMKLLNSENIGAALKEQDSIGEVAYPAKTKFTSGDFATWLSKGATQKSWERRLKNFSKIAKKMGGPYVDRPLQMLHDIHIKQPSKNVSVYLEKAANFGELNAVYYESGEVVKVGQLNFSDPEVSTVREMQEAAKMAFNTGSSICVLGNIEESKVGFIGVDMAKELKLITEPGVYEAEEIGPEGVQKVLVFAIGVVPLGQTAVPGYSKMVFVVEDEDGLNYSQQDSVAGKPADAERFGFAGNIIPLRDVERYDRGFLLYSEGGDISHCSELIKIDRIESTPRGNIRVFMKTESGDVHYLIDDNFKRVIPLSEKGSLYSQNMIKNFTGPNLPMLKVKAVSELVSSLDKHQFAYESDIMKAAGAGDEMIVRSVNGKTGGQFRGRVFDDDPGPFMARMVSLGVSPEKTAALLSYVSQSGNHNPVTVVGIKSTMRDEEGAVLDPNYCATVAKDIREMRSELIKAAAAIEAGGEQEAASAILGLGMVDEENIRYFVQLLPTLEDVANILAKMLFSARIDAIKVDEGAIKSALVNVTKIIGRLREISSGI